MSQLHEKKALLDAELEPGEELLWFGEPNPKRTLKAGPFAPVGIFVFVMLAAAIGPFHFHGNSFSERFNLLLPLALLLMFGYVAVVPPISSFIQAKNTIYGISTSHVFVIVAGRSRLISSQSRNTIGTISRRERPDGTGDILFTRAMIINSTPYPSLMQFNGITKVREVEKLLRTESVNETPET